MPATDRKRHWDEVYGTKSETEVSWFEEDASLSRAVIERCAKSKGDAIADIGGGASRLIDGLVEAGYLDLTVLDVSEKALAASRRRLSLVASKVVWLTADVTTWEPERYYKIWHDRAVFHFLTSENDRVAYAERLRRALLADACAIIGTFALDGPPMCSGLPVMRYDSETLGQALGPGFALIDTLLHDHCTSAGKRQKFQFSVFRRR